MTHTHTTIGRRLTTAAACLLLGTGVIACGEDEDEPAAASGSAPSAKAGAGKEMALVVGSSSDDFYKAIECGAKTEAEKQGVKLNIQGPSQFDAALQVPIVNAVAAKKPDAIIIAPTDDTALFQPLKQAADGGAELVFVDTTLKQADVGAGHIGSDYVTYGRQGAQELGKLLGGKGKVLGIFAPPGVSTNDQGRKGFKAALEEEFPDIELLPFEYSNGSPGKSAAILSAVLGANPDLKGVFTYNGGDAQGIVTALREKDAADRVSFVSGDAQPFQVEQLEADQVKALVVQRANEMGVRSVQYALDAIAGKDVPDETALETVVATKENVTDETVATNLYKGC